MAHKAQAQVSTSLAMASFALAFLNGMQTQVSTSILMEAHRDGVQERNTLSRGALQVSTLAFVTH
eukprot:1100339-Pelagomonas_calceolata.AAC.4